MLSRKNTNKNYIHVREEEILSFFAKNFNMNLNELDIDYDVHFFHGIEGGQLDVICKDYIYNDSDIEFMLEVLQDEFKNELMIVAIDYEIKNGSTHFQFKFDAPIYNANEEAWN